MSPKNLKRIYSDQNIVVESNALVEASYNLTVLEHKIICLAAACIQRHDDDFEEIQFRVTDLCKILQISPKVAYSEFDKLSDKLMRRQLVFRDDEKKTFKKRQWVQACDYENGYLTFKFSDELKPYLLNLNRDLTIYEVSQILKLTSNYAIRLYKLLKQYQRIGRRSFSLTPEYNPKNWISFQQVMAYPDSYTRYSNLNQRVLQPAIEQIREHTEFKRLVCEPEKHKGKSYGVTFEFSAIETREHSFSNTPLFQQLTDIGVNEALVQRWFENYDEGYIQANVDYVQEKLIVSKVNNPAGYMARAISNNYAKYDPNAPKQELLGFAAEVEDWEGLAKDYDGDRKQFILHYLPKASKGDQNTFRKWKFGNPYIVDLLENFVKDQASGQES